MGQRNGWMVAACLLAAAYVVRPYLYAADDVGRMRTILLREASERAARDALEQERRRLGERTDPRTVAVATFRNVGTPAYAPLGKALAAMLIDNLSALPGIKVLEREQVEALEQEAKLSGTGL